MTETGLFLLSAMGVVSHGGTVLDQAAERVRIARPRPRRRRPAGPESLRFSAFLDDSDVLDVIRDRACEVDELDPELPATTSLTPALLQPHLAVRTARLNPVSFSEAAHWAVFRRPR